MALSESFNQLSAFLEPLNEVLVDPAWPQVALLVRVVLMLGIFALLAMFVFIGFREKREQYVPVRPAAGLRWLSLLGAAALGLFLARQAQWQLFGLQRPEFVQFMQRYDRREFNPAHKVRSGKILDRNGEVLAVSRLTDQGVKRLYPRGPVFSHALGYNHPLYGLSGLESACRGELLGGALKSSSDLKRLGANLIDREAGAEGPPMMSTLDAGLQQEAYAAFAEDRLVGAVVMMDVQTGDVRVMMSNPCFDPNRLRASSFTERQREAPMLNRALAGRYPPGSVFKILIAAAALETGFSGTFDCPPEGFTTSKANPRIRDHEFYEAQSKGHVWRGHGRLGMGEALAKSSNVFFAQLGPHTGQNALQTAWNHAGFGQTIPLHSRADGTLQVRPGRHQELRDTRPYDLAQFSIGQGKVEVSPMQITMLCAAIARGGQGVMPRLDPRESVRELPRLMTPHNARTLKWMMHRVVKEGTGRRIHMSALPVAGKTGTAETGGRRLSHSWFAGFAPVSQPKVAFCVLVEHGGYGSKVALPIAKTLLETALKQGEFSP